jgi:Polyketide cyclase / dehydrase and lipid transport
MSNEYEFVTRWRVEGTCGEVADILSDPLDLPRWWPAVYLRVDELQPPGANGLGRRVRLHTKGWLPYTLTWEAEQTESRYPYGSTLIATGDFDGVGIWTFEQDGGFVNITYDWRLQAEKPLLRTLSFALKPVFEANHRWAMDQGEQSLKLELARRRATSNAQRAQIPPPPGPITYAGAALLGGGVAIGASLAYLMLRSRRDHEARETTPRTPRNTRKRPDSSLRL